MINNCDQIKDMIIPYINKKLSDKEKLIFLNHLVNCKECLKEYALILKIQKALQTSIKEMPKEIKIHAFDKIKHNQIFQSDNMGQDITNLFTKKIPTPMTSIEVVTYLMSKISDSVKLSIKNI